MSAKLLDPRILNALDHGIPVITAQRSQARYLRYAYARHKKMNDISAWKTPQLFTWDDWVIALSKDIMWSGYVPMAGQRKLLLPAQEKLIWEQIVAQHSDNLLLDNVGGTASRARQAWGLIQAWRLPDPKTAQFPNRDVRIFSKWMRAYYSMMAKRNWLDQARLPDSVSPAIRSGAIVPTEQLVLTGFHGFTPQQRVLLKTLENTGTKFHLVKQKKIKGQLERVAFADQDQELDAAARWARVMLSNKNPGVSAILIPNLDRCLGKVLSKFDDVLSPGSSLPTSSMVGRPYSVSRSQSFHRNKFVVGAMAVLRISLETSFFPQISTFLRSPFIRAAGAEQPMRSRFELWLRNNNIDAIEPDELVDLLEIYSQRRDPDAGQSVLSAMLSGLKPLLTKLKGKHSASYWASRFREILNVAGWPGDSTLNVVEVQAVEKLNELLDELSGLDFLVPGCTAQQALSYFDRVIRGAGFRANLPETSVQIMQPEEAFGLRFDQVWVAGWHNQNWPEAPSSNPFLPIEWQRQYKIPGSSSELQLQQAITITEDLCGAGGRVIFSYPKSSDEEELDESPLIRKVPATLRDSMEIEEITDYCEVIRAATDLEEFSDDIGPKLSEIHFPKGGSTIFRLQSQCPFKAFAELRLGASPWVVPRSGVSAIDKGNHLHKALEFIWAKISNSETLVEVFATEHLENQVYREVELALSYQDRKRVRPLPNEVRNLEQQRLVRQILQMLAVERHRPPFEVSAHEVVKKIQVGPLIIEARIDRVDHVVGKGLMLIDYKLGERKSNVWKQPRMSEPQLPLYTIAYDQPVAAISFLNGKLGAIGLQGLGDSPGIADGVQFISSSSLGKAHQHDWAGQLLAWKEELQGLAEDYASGEAKVNPVNANACRYCDLKSLCRIGQNKLMSADADE